MNILCYTFGHLKRRLGRIKKQKYNGMGAYGGVPPRKKLKIYLLIIYFVY
jgi:hypothetical protein